MNIFDEQKKACSFIEKTIKENKKISHAYLIETNDYYNYNNFIKYLIKSILCLNSNNSENSESQTSQNSMQNSTINEQNNNADIYIPNFTDQSLYNIEKIYNLSDDGQKRVYLTFDDGPSRDVTPLVLDILKEENVYATFFVLGSKVEQNPDILKRIYDEGHYIGNHGYSHVYSTIYTNVDTVINEYNKYNYVVVNDNIIDATNKVDAILLASKCSVDRIESLDLQTEEEIIHEILIS